MHQNTIKTLTAFLSELRTTVGDLANDPWAWEGFTFGLLEAFRVWLLNRGDAIGTVNAHVSHVRTFAKLAAKAGVISADDLMRIQAVKTISHREGLKIDEDRAETRRGFKKAECVEITEDQARQLKNQPDTAQGRRDALLMCLLLDHGLRVGEVARLLSGECDLESGELHFYRPKVDKVQTHRLSPDTLEAAQNYFKHGHAPSDKEEPLLRASRKGGFLTNAGMTERAITKRANELGERIDLPGLSAHDCRHYWTTYWARQEGVNPFDLQQAGGWKSIGSVMPYVQARGIANEGLKKRDE